MVHVNKLNNQSEFYKNRLSNTELNSSVYFLGNLPGQGEKTLGIIGTRRPTTYGTSVIRSLTEGLVGYPINVISGLAIGIDSLAHKEALRVGLKTTSVIPSDLQNIYPPRHSNLAKQIVSSGGCLLSLHKSLSRPFPSDFHSRNYLLAAICDAIIVIEAAERSGTMITVRFGLEMGKPILSVPGRVGDTLSAGTNRLISEGAIPLLSARDVIDVLGLKPKQQTLFYTEEQLKIIQIVSRGINEINQVQQQSGYNSQDFNSHLTEMELDGVVSIQAGRIYKRGLA